MIDFWIGAGLLLLAALTFLLLPLLKGRHAQAEEDRTALNVALYQERLAELDAQRQAGTLTDTQHEDGRVEAARELLEDTEVGAPARRNRLGRGVPLLAALLVPAVAFGLYLHWGASDKLALSRQFAEMPQSIEAMTQRLEQVVKAQPDSAEGWYFLGRSYMAQERPADAARAFRRVIDLAGREPDLLGQLAQALYFAGDKQWTPELQQLTDEALRGDPNDATSLGLLGIAAFEGGRFRDAVGYWERLVAALPEGDPSREAVQSGIDRAKAELGDDAVAQVEPPTPAAGAQVQVEVSLADAVRDQVQPDDSVFVFARAVSGPPMPLAVKRLSVEQLPATVTLGDADAMMPQLKLSKFDNVRLVARISRKGDATRGEWYGQTEAVQPAKASGAIALVVDRAERPDANR